MINGIEIERRLRKYLKLYTIFAERVVDFFNN